MICSTGRSDLGFGWLDVGHVSLARQPEFFPAPFQICIPSACPPIFPVYEIEKDVGKYFPYVFCMLSYMKFSLSYW